MRDILFIDDLLVRTIIGVADWERKTLQDVKISLALSTDIKKAAQSDTISDAIDYSCVATSVTTLVKNSRCHLIEKLAHDVAEHVLANFPVHAVKVRLEKPGAVPDTKTVGVEIFRAKDGEIFSHFNLHPTHFSPYNSPR